MNLRTIDTQIKKLSRFVEPDGVDVWAEKYTKNRPIPVCEDVINAFDSLKLKVLHTRNPKRKFIGQYWNNRILMHHMKFFQNPTKYYMVLFHELAHWFTETMGRQHGGGDIKYATEEMTAQLTACYLIKLLGLNGWRMIEIETAAYLLLYKKGNLKTAQRRAKNYARDILKYCEHVYH